jgi:hypothetical protein
VKAGGFLTGTPADITEQLEALEKRYPGLDRLVCSMALGTPLAVVLEQLTRFATEVTPAFRREKAAARAAAE